jgi:uncharacterized repeat protein (TIGR03803 family)
MIRSFNSYCKSAVFGSLALAIVVPFASAQAGETVLHYFGGAKGHGTDGAGPVSALTTDANGNMFGTTELGGTGCPGKRTVGCGTVFEIAAGGAESVLYSFTGNADGGFPEASVVLDSSGNIYGTTTRGGAFNQGTVFEVSGGVETVLYSFQGGTDGSIPADGLTMDSAGNLYGTTEQGGNPKGCQNQGCGTVFQIASGGAETVLYRFKGGNDGWFPVGNLQQDASGNLYGTTEYSGNTGRCSGTGCGTVFKISTGGAKSTLYTFQGNAGTTFDGALPMSGLIFDGAGNLYGTTKAGGNGPGCYGGCGTAFELVNNGGSFSEKTLYAFQGWSAGQHIDGAFPWDSLLLDGNGNLFGTTQGGGNKCGCGTVFELSPGQGGTYNESVLFSFSRGIGNGTTGFSPENSVVTDGNGNLFGTTFSGGFRHSGVAFEISTAADQKN